MSIFVVVVLTLTAFLLLIAFYKKKRPPFLGALDDAKPWLAHEGIDLASIRLSGYDDPDLVENEGAIEINVLGKKLDGSYAAFALEVVKGQGVVKSAQIDPIGVRTHHRNAAEEARSKSMSLVATLADRARRHRALFPDKWPNG